MTYFHGLFLLLMYCFLIFADVDLEYEHLALGVKVLNSSLSDVVVLFTNYLPILNCNSPQGYEVFSSFFVVA